MGEAREKVKADTTGLASVMSAQDVMDWLGIKRSKLYHLIDLGLPFRSLSEDDRTKVFVSTDIQAWLDTRKRTREHPEVVAGETEPKPKRGRPKESESKPGERKWIKGF